eukprot:COSAG01_NODE_45924_length_405_cov_0.323529_1_plen_31_part_01
MGGGQGVLCQLSAGRLVSVERGAIFVSWVRG